MQNVRIFAAGKLQGTQYAPARRAQDARSIVIEYTSDSLYDTKILIQVQCTDYRDALKTAKNWGVEQVQDLVNPEALERADKAHLLDARILY